MSLTNQIRDILSAPFVGYTPEDSARLFATEEFCTEFKDVFAKTFSEHGSGLRVSSLGKPVVLQAMGLVGYKDSAPSQLYIPFEGNFWEAWCRFVLRSYGLNVTDVDTEVSFLGVKGHTDFVVELPNGFRLLCECKSLGYGYGDGFVDNPDDERGYLTQLAIYKRCLNVDAACWIVFHKGKFKVHVIEPFEKVMKDKLVQAAQSIRTLREVKTMEDVLLIEPPAPVAEKYRGKLTGLFVPSVGMTYTKFLDLWYEIAEKQVTADKVKKYVVGVKSHAERVDTAKHLNLI